MKIYPGLSRYLLREFCKSVMELSIVVILGLFATFRSEYFRKRPVVQNLRLDRLLTLVAITHGKLGEHPEQMRESVKKFDIKTSTVSWTKMLDFRHTNPLSITTKLFWFRRTVGKRPAPTHLRMPSYEGRSHSIDQGHQRVCDGDIRSSSDIRVP